MNILSYSVFCIYIKDNNAMYVYHVKFTCWSYIYGFIVGEGVDVDKPADGSSNLFGFPINITFFSLNLYKLTRFIASSNILITGYY